jgi:hypothetical protein
MGTSAGPQAPGGAGTRRVRDQARETLAVIVFSASCSVGLSVGFVLLASLAR